MNKMHGYQLRATQFSIERPASYLAIDMGLGKTWIGLEWIKTKKNPVLVLGPLRAINTTWPMECEKWTPEQTYRVWHGTDKVLRPRAKIYTMNFAGLPWLYAELFKLYKAKKPMPFSSIIIDEASLVKSHRTKRFKMMMEIKNLCTEGLLMLSGTPSPNSLLDLWAQYYILDGGKRLGSSFNKFRSDYFETYDTRTGAGRVAKNFLEAEKMRWRPKSKEIEEIIFNKVADITYRLEAADYLDLPEKIDNVIEVTLPVKALTQIEEMRKKSVLTIGPKTITSDFAGSLVMKFRQMAQGAIYHNQEFDEHGNKLPRTYDILHDSKLKVLKELVEEANGQGILCAIQFKFELEILRQVFPTAPAIVGGSNPNEFRSIVTSWNRGEIPLLICHPASLSHSVNLQAGSHLLVWYALPWSLEQYLQLNARLHRQGQQHAVIIHHLVAMGTIDQRVLQALRTKEFNQNIFLDYLKGITNAYTESILKDVQTSLVQI